MQAPSREPSVDLAIPFWRQFRWQLITAFVLLAVVPVILIQTATNTVSRSAAQAQVFNQLQSVADLKRDQIERWLSDSTMALTFLLSRPVSDQMIAFASMPTPTADEQAQID